jgi:hypothetical protein
MATRLKFKHVAKDRLFYGEWQYCVSFRLPEVSVVKVIDHDYVDTFIERRKSWIEISQQRWSRIPMIGGNKTNRLTSKITRTITDQNVEDLHTLVEILLDTDVAFKLVTSVDQAWIYSNNKKLIYRLANTPQFTQQQFTQAVVTRPKDSIKLNNPRHTHRSYFKSMKLSDNEKDTLINFFHNQQDNIRISPAFLAWLNSPYHRSQDYFFMDHSGDSWLVLLSLVKPGIVRKTLDIIPA